MLRINKELHDRFFSLFPDSKQKDVAEELFPGESYEKKQPQISKWKRYKEPIPKDVLIKIASVKDVSINWLLTGETKESKKKSPPAAASGGKGVDVELIEVVFQLQETLSVLGQHLAAGKSADVFPKIADLLGNVQRLQERLAALQQTPGIHDRTA